MTLFSSDVEGIHVVDSYVVFTLLLWILLLDNGMDRWQVVIVSSMVTKSGQLQPVDTKYLEMIENTTIIFFDI